VELHIVDPDPSWPAQFRAIATHLRAIVGDRAVRIDHIGSTAVPGLCSKDLLDVQITVTDDEGLDDVAGLLEAGGWVFHRPVRRDHEVPGGPTDPDEWAKRLCGEPTGERRANVHIRVTDRANQRYALLFRDYLRAHPDVAAAYGEFKRRAAVMVRDTEDYPDLKDPVCDLIYLPAEGWAAATGWSPEPTTDG
jgi:GrpB-like predicted nucleotidyltransferase (UPF0157 family)